MYDQDAGQSQILSYRPCSAIKSKDILRPGIARLVCWDCVSITACSIEVILMMQVPLAVRMASFYKGAILRLLETLADLQKVLRRTCDILLHSGGSSDRLMWGIDVQQRFALLSNVVSAIQTSAQSCLSQSF